MSELPFLIGLSSDGAASAAASRHHRMRQSGRSTPNLAGRRAVAHGRGRVGGRPTVSGCDTIAATPSHLAGGEDATRVSRVLLVGDDQELGPRLESALAARGLAAVSVADATSALSWASTGDVDVIVLDLALPGLDGYQLLGRLRSAGMDMPVVVTADSAKELDHVARMDLGADAYLVKPLSILVLTAQLRAMLRRRDSHRHAPHELRAGQLRLHLPTRTATWKDQQVQLSDRQFAVLHALAIRCGHVISSAELRTLVWTDRPDTQPNAVQYSISRLRRRLHIINAAHLIQTTHGLGYQLRLPAEPHPHELPHPSGYPGAVRV